jgi:hypothetical protein
MELYLHSSITPSWCGAQLKHRDSFATFVNITFIITTVPQNQQLRKCIYNQKMATLPQQGNIPQTNSITVDLEEDEDLDAH